MEVNIQYINVYNDGLIQMIVICNSCKKKNIHTITHASTNLPDKIKIDFANLGKRCCDNFKCDADYNLYG